MIQTDGRTDGVGLGLRLRIPYRWRWGRIGWCRPSRSWRPPTGRRSRSRRRGSSWRSSGNRRRRLRSHPDPSCRYPADPRRWCCWNPGRRNHRPCIEWWRGREHPARASRRISPARRTTKNHPRCLETASGDGSRRSGGATVARRMKGASRWTGGTILNWAEMGPRW